ncbi:TPA: class IIb bacteriocin, lactobin A/cerein 7B family [Streptococcus suis]
MKDSTIEKKFTKLYDTELSEIDGGFIPLIWGIPVGVKVASTVGLLGGGLAWGYFK